MEQPDWYRPPAGDGGERARGETEDRVEIRPPATVSFWPRAAARLVDVGIGIGLAFAIDAVIASAIERGLTVPRMQFSPLGLTVAGIPASIVSNAIAEGIGGATLGKVMLGLRVRMMDGRACTAAAALKRSTAYLFDALFFGLVAYGSMKRSAFNQRHGDRWAGSVVVRASALPGTSRFDQRAAVGAFLGAVVGLLWDALTDVQMP